MNLIYNGKLTPVANDGITMAQFVEEQNVPTKGCAVAVNGKLVPRKNWDTFMLKDGDDVVAINAAYGG